MKPSRRRVAWTGWRLRLVAAAVGILVCGYITTRTVSLFSNLSVFKVQRIVVHGNHRLGTGEVLALVDGLKGKSILSVNLEEWRASIMNSPWVGDALLHRTLPATVDIAIVERMPLGVARINGSLYLVDERGTVIDEYGPNYGDLDLPIIDGLSAVPGDVSPDVPRAMLARRLLDALRTGNMASRISQIDVSDARNAVVLLDGDPTSVRLGDERFVERLQSYFDLAPALRDRIPGIDYVDMRFDERVYVKPSRQAAAAAQPSRLPDRPTKRRTQVG